MRPDRETLQRLYIDERMTTRQIAPMFGVDRVSVGRWLDHYDIPKRPGGRGLANRGIEPPTADELHRLLNIDHLGYREVAARFGVDFTAITHWCRRLGVRAPTVWETRRRGSEPRWPADAVLAARYADGESLACLDGDIGAGRTAIMKRLRSLGIEVRRDGWDGGKRFTCRDGHVVRSTYEQRVCEWLTAREISHEYEPRLPWDRRSAADFLANGWYVEIWGVTHSPLYGARRARKVAAYRAHSAPLIEIHAHDFFRQKRGRWERKLAATVHLSTLV